MDRNQKFEFEMTGQLCPVSCSWVLDDYVEADFSGIGQVSVGVAL
jgi:hypothetical protein